MRLSGSIAPAIKHHPLTGMAIEPLWVRPDGKVCWPMMGGAPDDDDDKDDDGDDNDADDDKDDDDTGSDGEDSDKVSKADLERALARMKAADKRAAAAERKLEEEANKKKDDLTLKTDELAAAQERIKELEGTVSSMRLNNSFLTTNKHTWHDADAALELAQSKGYLDGVMDEESGEVDKKALSAALDRLAKDKPYLVKEDDSDDKDKDKGEPPSGHGAPRRSKNNQDEDAKRAERKKRFPVLNNR